MRQALHGLTSSGNALAEGSRPGLRAAPPLSVPLSLSVRFLSALLLYYANRFSLNGSSGA